ncbi:MAG: ABC transporter substrate-binding protein [Actinomycetota bacterium]
MTTRWFQTCRAFLVVGVLAAACGGSDADDTATEPATATTAPDTTTPDTTTPDTTTPDTTTPDTTTPDSTSPDTTSPATTTPETTAPETTTPETTTPETTTSVPAEEFPPSPYSRIFVSGGPMLDAALALDLPVAATPGRNDRDAIPDYLVDLATDVEVLSNLLDVNIEELAAFDPDLLLLTQSIIDFAGTDVLDPIGDIGIADISTNTPWRDALQSVADAAGVSERGPGRIAETEAIITAGADLLTDEQRALEVSIIRCVGDQCRYLPAGTSFPGQVLDDLGIARPDFQQAPDDGSPFVNVSPERYDLLGGDLILLFGTDADDSIAALEANPLWNSLEAVQAGLVFRVAPDPWFAGSVLAVEYIVDDIVAILQEL